MSGRELLRFRKAMDGHVAAALAARHGVSAGNKEAKSPLGTVPGAPSDRPDWTEVPQVAGESESDRYDFAFGLWGINVPSYYESHPFAALGREYRRRYP